MASAHRWLVRHMGCGGGSVPFYSTPSAARSLIVNKSFLLLNQTSRFSSLDGLHRNLLEMHLKKRFSPGADGCLRHRLACLPGTTDAAEPTEGKGGPIEEEEEESVGGRRRRQQLQQQMGRRRELGEELSVGAVANAVEDALPAQDFSIIAACTVGLLTGISVVLFNNAVHEIRDFFWDGIPSRGASWLREEPLGEIWQRVILVPAFGGVIVSLLNSLRNTLETPSGGTFASIKGAMRPFLKPIAASVTLGTGNSLGPEGPSVEIGASIAKGVGNVFGSVRENNLSLIAAGSAAGISSGFNAAVAGCFFAVESVLWPSSTDSFSSVSNSTSMVILSAVIASVISEVGLGSDPAFTVPEYDFRSPSELPLYLLLGILCGLVSLTLSTCTSYAMQAVDYVHKTTGITKAVFPALGGLTVGLIALAYPEVLYWGFENVDILLESQPFVKGLPADLLLQLVGVKIVATSLSRASGLVGGYYAPSLFIGAATGAAYGKFMGSALSGTNSLFHLPILEVASPQAYGLVGMAATLAGVCQVPLTSVLLLFELTQDYRIVLPLLGAVGLSSLIAPTQKRKRVIGNQIESMKVEASNVQQPKCSLQSSQVPSNSTTSAKASYTADLCELESSLCVYEFKNRNWAEKLTVSQAMRTRYVTVLMSMPLIEAVNLMLIEKQSCAVVVDNENCLVDLLALEDIQNISKAARAREKHAEVEKLLVSEICHFEGKKCRVWAAATPNMTLLSAESIMDSHGVSHLPVVSEHTGGHRGGYLIGLLDRECISVACRAMAAKEIISHPI